jgi:L-lactate dehydrogenase complex protein LldF
VYERTGGHAYGSVYPGPIGAVLNPQLRGVDNPVDKSLPYASSLCGACFDACPVRIEIPRLLVRMRTRVVEKGGKAGEAAAMAATAWLFGDAKRLEAAQRGSTIAGRVLKGRRIGPLPGPLAAWTDARDLPAPPQETFRQWWRRTHGAPRPHDAGGQDPR